MLRQPGARSAGRADVFGRRRGRLLRRSHPARRELPENFPYGLNYTPIPAQAPYAGYVLDLGSATMFHAAGAHTAPRPITLYSVHSQDRNVRVLRNGRVVKRGLRLLSVNGRWTWAPRRHGTYVVRWTSRGVAHARSVTC